MSDPFSPRGVHPLHDCYNRMDETLRGRFFFFIMDKRSVQSLWSNVLRITRPTHPAPYPSSGSCADRVGFTRVNLWSKVLLRSVRFYVACIFFF